MAMFRRFILIFIFHAARMVYAQDDQSGFISLDCGAPHGSYTDNSTGINYVSDDEFIEGGVTYKFDNESNVLSTLRFFPEHERNCYTLRPQQGKNNRYLIRGKFGYGNYDGINQNPQFDLYLGADYWTAVNITDSMVAKTHEIIHLSLSDYINVCLINTGHGIPIISALELRLLNITMYESQFQSLILSYRTRFGTNEIVRYEDDMYDRIWRPLSVTGSRTINNSDLVSAGPSDKEKVPLKVMSTGVTPINATHLLTYPWPANPTDTFIIYIHIAELEILKSNQKREFNIYLNGNYFSGPISPSTSITTLSNQSAYTGYSSYKLELTQTENSTLPPIYNAIEVYTVKQLLQNQTDDRDVSAIWNTKSMYGLKKNWQGDPCVPQAYAWDGLNCSYKDTTPRIISLNLSSSGLSGEIITALANLTMIESLDLSYNNLTGTVPKFLASLDFLKVLNLTGNNFTRPLPAELLAKSKKGSLFFSIEERSDDKRYCLNGSCTTKNNKHTKVVVPVIVVIAAFIVLLITSVIVWIIKRRNTKDLIILGQAFKPRNQEYTYFEVQSITNNFKTAIGKGGFGTVFHGYIGDNQVAVKMLSESSAQGYNEFQAEVTLLMDVRHKNITSLVGYCNDSNHKGIIYEYMANGNLGQHLFDGSSNVLSWVRRLQIGCDAAEGLAYMHHGCRPSIVHRDVKSSNILLNEGFQAKLADFGLSRAFTSDDASHVSTAVVAGTYGYIDPDSTNRLTVKSDVYSFGVVILELITSRRAISEKINIINWVKSTVAEGHVENIIDPRLQGNFNTDTAWKVVELAIACVSYASMKRPTMNDVMMELKNCLQAEQTHRGIPNDESLSLNLEDMSGPNIR